MARTLGDLVRDAAAREGDKPAVWCGEASISYRELDRLAEAYQSALSELRLRPGERLVLWCEKSIAVVAVMQAALRTGVVYVPVSPANPPARAAAVAQHCGASVVLVDDSAERAFRDAVADEDPAFRISTVEALAENMGSPVSGNRCWPAPQDLAYILYTSGSTGEPKGVCVSHHSALAFVEWAVVATGLQSGDRLANHAPFNFDLSVFDIYAAFSVGASVDLIPSMHGHIADLLLDYLYDRNISVWYLVPSVFRLLALDGELYRRGVPRSLRVCVFAGEPLPVRDVRALRKTWPGIRLFNWYGPTETNVCTSYEIVDVQRLSAEDGVPIGRPASGAAVWIHPPGAVEGEIVIKGPTVMMGYWGAECQSGPYFTGDMGKYDERGELLYLGRRDGMVKVAGNRVELGAVETVLEEHPDVATAAVVAVGAGLETRLHGTIVARNGKRTSLLELKAHCACKLPDYMVIDTVSFVDEHPLNANGKLDRMGLKKAFERKEE